MGEGGGAVGEDSAMRGDGVGDRTEGGGAEGGEAVVSAEVAEDLFSRAVSMASIAGIVCIVSEEDDLCNLSCPRQLQKI